MDKYEEFSSAAPPHLPLHFAKKPNMTGDLELNEKKHQIFILCPLTSEVEELKVILLL